MSTQPLADLTRAIRESVARAISSLIGRFEVATVTPDFTVYLNGSTNAVPGAQILGLAGGTYVVGTTGVYVHRQGQKPLCIPTA